LPSEALALSTGEPNRSNGDEFTIVGISLAHRKARPASRTASPCLAEKSVPKSPVQKKEPYGSFPWLFLCFHSAFHIEGKRKENGGS
jgi:hypothetical protein